MYKSDFEIKKEICEIGKRVHANGFVGANDGSISVKLDDNTFFITPSGVSKGYMTPDMICKVDANGKLKDANKRKPSAEFEMHIKVYKERPDVFAIVQAHTPILISFAIAGTNLDKLIEPNGIVPFGPVPVAQYATPATVEMPDSLSQYVKDHDALLLGQRGIMFFGSDLTKAFFKMEATEFYAKLAYHSKMLGAKEIPKSTAKACENAICQSENGGCATGASEDSIKAVVAEVTKRVLENYGK